MSVLSEQFLYDNPDISTDKLEGIVIGLEIYKDSISKTKETEKQLLNQTYELIGYLKRLLVAAKPHCYSTESVLYMRINESEQILKKYESDHGL